MQDVSKKRELLLRDTLFALLAAGLHKPYKLLTMNVLLKEQEKVQVTRNKIQKNINVQGLIAKQLVVRKLFENCILGFVSFLYLVPCILKFLTISIMNDGR